MTNFLFHGAFVRLPEWLSGSYATVGSVEGYAKQNGKDPAKALAKAQGFGHEIVWAIHAGTALVNDGGACHRRDATRWELAEVLTEGRRVEIEGRPYVVTVDPRQRGKSFPQFSNPISFTPAA